MEKGTMHVVELRRTIKAPREKVFEAWTQPEQMKRWACPEGVTLESVESDPRPGGTYRLAMRGEEGERHTAHGSYRVVEPPARLVYTWDWEEEDQAMGETVVTVEFLVVDEGTEVVLVHRGFPAPEAAGGHEEGWGSCLNKLQALF